MSKVHHTHCPVCRSANIRYLMDVKDHSVSGEVFPIWECAECTLRFTQDVPDEDSIGPYYQSEDYISHTNTNKGLINTLYQRVRKITLEGKAKLVMSRTVPKGKLLDMGAGIGAFLNTMKGKGWEVTGIEPDPGARQQALDLFGIRLEPTSYLAHLPEASFDAITLWHVLEHVHQLQDYVEQLKRLLTPRGRLLIAVPNYTAQDAAIYGGAWAAYDVPRHLYHFTPRSIDTLMQRHGMSVLEKKPMWFDAFYISLLSSKYRHGQTNLVGAGFSGLRSNLKALGNSDRCSSVIYIIGK
jgi:SAM-dependent methyltransferase